MSLGKFIHHILEAIGNLFREIPKDLQDAIHIGVVVTDKLKTWVESEGANVLTAIIPGDLDEVIKVKLRAWLPKILIELKLADDCSHLGTPEEIVACALKVLQQIEGDFKSAFLHDISILIAQVVSDGKLDWKDGAILLQWYYEHKYKEESTSP